MNGMQKASELEELIAEANSILKEASVTAEDVQDTTELRDMAIAEIEELELNLPGIQDSLTTLLLPRDEVEDRSAILEVRAGTGGEEAAHFAGDLFRMYEVLLLHSRTRTLRTPKTRSHLLCT